MRLAYKWQASLIVALGLFMAILDNTIVSVTLPQMLKAFHTDFETITWVVTGYFLAQAAVIPLVGYLSDRIGADHLPDPTGGSSCKRCAGCTAHITIDRCRSNLLCNGWQERPGSQGVCWAAGIHDGLERYLRAGTDCVRRVCSAGAVRWTRSRN